VKLRGDYFDRLYAADPDPWRFETSAYEHEKYDATVAALDGRRARRALEVGCSIGVLTERLAPHAGELLSVDVSEAALAQARDRLAPAPHVEFARRELPEDFPRGPFDLIVCSEVLYYLDTAAFSAMLDAIDRELEPGGSLLAVHWRARTETYPLQGDEVHALLDRRFGPPARSHRDPRYALDRFDRAA
jgi:SAM-dependent methyltransferase